MQQTLILKTVRCEQRQDDSKGVREEMMEDFPTVFHMHMGLGDNSRILCKMIPSAACSLKLKLLNTEVWLSKGIAEY